MLLSVIACTAGNTATTTAAAAFDSIPRPRTLFTGSSNSNNGATNLERGKKHPKYNSHDSNTKLTVSKYSVSGRGTRYRRDIQAVFDEAQIEAPAPALISTLVAPEPARTPAMDMEPSTTIWPFSYLFGGPSRRRVVVSRRGRPYGTYRRKGWWPSGSAVRDAWW